MSKNIENHKKNNNNNNVLCVCLCVMWVLFLYEFSVFLLSTTFPKIFHNKKNIQHKNYHPSFPKKNKIKKCVANTI